MEKAVLEILQESWNSSILLTRVASHSTTASKNWGHSGRRLLVIHSVDFQWMPGNGTTSKCIYLRCWSDLSSFFFQCNPLTHQQECGKPTQRTGKRTTSITDAKPLNLSRCFFFRFAVLFGAEMVIKLIAFGLVTCPQLGVVKVLCCCPYERFGKGNVTWCDVLVYCNLEHFTRMMYWTGSAMCCIGKPLKWFYPTIFHVL